MRVYTHTRVYILIRYNLKRHVPSSFRGGPNLARGAYRA